MKRYLIKVTYLDGEHEGKSYLMTRGGYITKENFYHGIDDTYATKTSCKRICTRLYNRNEHDYKQETANREYKIKNGKEISTWRIYYHQSFEPYEVLIPTI